MMYVTASYVTYQDLFSFMILFIDLGALLFQLYKWNQRKK